MQPEPLKRGDQVIVIAHHADLVGLAARVLREETLTSITGESDSSPVNAYEIELETGSRLWVDLDQVRSIVIEAAA